jgi:hypothetical protein
MGGIMSQNIHACKQGFAFDMLAGKQWNIFMMDGG